MNTRSDNPEATELQWTSPGDESPVQIYDCWNTIGVSGNGSCRELTRYVHCRNCPVYSTAAAQLLDRPVSAELQREWSSHYALEKKAAAAARTSVIVFRLDTEWLALPTSAFQEVAENRPIHTLPHRRHGLVLGLANIRGELLICVSLARLLGFARPPKRQEKVQGETTHRQRPAGKELRQRTKTALDTRLETRLMVANWDGKRLVFPTDEVHGIQRIHNDELREPPATLRKPIIRDRASEQASFEQPVVSPDSGEDHPSRKAGWVRHVFAWRGHTVGLLDAELLFAALNRNLV